MVVVEDSLVIASSLLLRHLQPLLLLVLFHPISLTCILMAVHHPLSLSRYMDLGFSSPFLGSFFVTFFLFFVLCLCNDADIFYCFFCINFAMLVGFHFIFDWILKRLWSWFLDLALKVQLLVLDLKRISRVSDIMYKVVTFFYFFFWEKKNRAKSCVILMFVYLFGCGLCFIGFMLFSSW